MAIVRALHNPENPYKKISSSVFNYGLSAKAIGVLCFLLNCSDRWEPNVNHLMTVFKDGKTAMQSALDELKSTGFLVRVAIRNKLGHIVDWRSVVHEEPINPAEIPNAGYYTTDIHGNYHKHARTLTPDTVYPDPDFPDLVNQAQTINKETIKKTTIKNSIDPPQPPQGANGVEVAFEFDEFAKEPEKDATQAPSLESKIPDRTLRAENQPSREEIFSAPRPETNSPVIEAEIVSSTPQDKFWYNHPTLSDWEALANDPEWESKLPKHPIHRNQPIYPWAAQFPKAGINFSCANLATQLNREFLDFYAKFAIKNWPSYKTKSVSDARIAIIDAIANKHFSPQERAKLLRAWLEMQRQKANVQSLTITPTAPEKTVGQISSELKMQQTKEYYQALLEQRDRVKAAAPKEQVPVSNPQAQPTPETPEPAPQEPAFVPMPEDIKAKTQKLVEAQKIKTAINQVLGWNCSKLKLYNPESCCQLLNVLVEKHQVPLNHIQDILNKFPNLKLEIYQGRVDLQF